MIKEKIGKLITKTTQLVVEPEERFDLNWSRTDEFGSADRSVMAPIDNQPNESDQTGFPLVQKSD